MAPGSDDFNDQGPDRRRSGNPNDAGGRRFARPGAPQSRPQDVRGQRGPRDERRHNPDRRTGDPRASRYSDDTVAVDDDFRDYEDIFRPEPVVTLSDRLKSFKPLLILAGLVLLALIVGYIVFRMIVPSGPKGNEVTIRINEGSGISSVANLLEQRNVVPSALGMRIVDQLDFKSLDIQAGEYAFRANSSASQAIAVLADGPKSTVKRLTIPEGMRVNQIADKVGEIEGFSAEKFRNLANSGTVRSRYQPQDSKTLEGFLFPDTYLLSGQENEETLMRQMVAQADNQAALAGIDNSLSKLSKTPYETMILASMIEAEAKTDGDRAKISRVIQNRIFKAMPLQIDATVLYGLNNTKQALSNRDLQTDTPYNSYTRKGLPPTPICNPGRDSIAAALNPVEGDWLYYVLNDEQGNHAFAETFEQHQKNIEIARSKGLL